MYTVQDQADDIWCIYKYLRLFYYRCFKLFVDIWRAEDGPVDDGDAQSKQQNSLQDAASAAAAGADDHANEPAAGER